MEKMGEFLLSSIFSCHITYIIYLVWLYENEPQLLPPSLVHFLGSPEFLKVGVGCLEDAIELEQYYKINVRGCVDLRSVLTLTRLVPTQKKGLKTLVRYYLGLTMSKSPSKWSSKKMKRSQQFYAAGDAFFALQVFYQFYNNVTTLTSTAHNVVSSSLYAQVVPYCCSSYELPPIESKLHPILKPLWSRKKGCGRLTKLIRSYLIYDSFSDTTDVPECKDTLSHSSAAAWCIANDIIDKAIKIARATLEKREVTGLKRYEDLRRLVLELNPLSADVWNTSIMEEVQLRATKCLRSQKYIDDNLYLQLIVKMCIYWRWRNLPKVYSTHSEIVKLFSSKLPQ